jgi:hypothetical protein
MRSIVPVLVTKLNADFDQLFKVVAYYCNLNDFSGYNLRDTTYNLQELPRLKYTENIEGVDVELDLLGKKINAARKDITLKQVLFAPPAKVTSNTAANNTFVQVPATTKSVNPVPVNSTAVNKPSTVKAPEVPIPVATSSTTEQKATETIQTAEQTKKASSSTDIASTSNPVASKTPASTPEFSRDTYAYSDPSPYGAVGALRDLVCRASDLSLKGAGKFKLPTLPDAIKNFSFKNAFTALAAKLESTLKGLVAALPKPPNLAQIFKDFAKTCFTCNPGNKK